MTSAAALLADLCARGIKLETDGARLRWRPAFMVSGLLAERLQAERSGLIELLTGPDCLERCPACHRALDAARRCPRCFDRICEGCGGMTGSYFLTCCLRCENRKPDSMLATYASSP